MNQTADANGIYYSSTNKVYLACNETVNSNYKFANLILKEVIFKDMRMFKGERCRVLVHDFKGHSKNEVKEYVKSLKSSNDNNENEDRCNLTDFLIIVGEITPVAQLIDIIISKVFKGLCRDEYDIHVLAVQTRNGYPIIPGR